MSLIIPFDNNPDDIIVITSNYTVPLGKYALLTNYTSLRTGSAVGNTGSGSQNITLNLDSTNTPNINNSISLLNSLNLSASAAPGFGATLNVNLPRFMAFDCMLATATGNAQVSGLFSFSTSGFVNGSYAAGSINLETTSGGPDSRGAALVISTSEKTKHWLKSGDQINIPANCQGYYVLNLYNNIT
jgi:hypothetical protein